MINKRFKKILSKEIGMIVLFKLMMLFLIWEFCFASSLETKAMSRNQLFHVIPTLSCQHVFSWHPSMFFSAFSWMPAFAGMTTQILISSH